MLLQEKLLLLLQLLQLRLLDLLRLLQLQLLQLLLLREEGRLLREQLMVKLLLRRLCPWRTLRARLGECCRRASRLRLRRRRRVAGSG